MTLYSRLLSLGPRIRKDGERLVASTGWRVWLLTLGLVARRVVVDPKGRTVVVRRRLLWFLIRRRSIPFGSIEAVTYGFQDWSFGSLLAFAYKTTDLFRVGLRLHNRDEIHLFSFLGAGAFTNPGPWPDWVYWEDYLLDLSGAQEGESRVFVDLLSKMIGVPVVPASV